MSIDIIFVQRQALNQFVVVRSFESVSVFNAVGTSTSTIVLTACERHIAQIHFVHYNTKYADIQTALQNEDGLAVLGVFAQVLLLDLTCYLLY